MTFTSAWLVPEIGQNPALGNTPIDPPRANEVRVRVAATGLNFADLLMIEGRYQDTPAAPFVPGMEISGVVEAAGAQVDRIEVGDRVMCVTNHGGLAGHVNVAADRVRRTPSSMDDITAAGFQIAYGTSHLALTRRAQLRPGETLTVLGAAGGVGLTAVEIGHRLGARVIAVVRGAEKLAIAKNAGADVLVDSGSGDLRDALREAGPADVVYDAIGGDAGDAALRAMAPEGRFLVIGFASGHMPTLKANHLLVKNQTVIGFYWGGYAKFRPEAVDESMSELCRWHAEGLIRPHIGHVLPFERASEGFDLLRDRKATGKIVVRQ